MEEIMNVIVNNGLGVASFVALIAFIFKYQTKTNETLDKISTNLTSLVIRIERLEGITKKDDN